MELLPIIYNSLLIVGALAFVVVIISYIAFKVRLSSTDEKKEIKKEVPSQVKVLIKKSKERAAELEKRKGSSSKTISPQGSSFGKSLARQSKLSSSHYKRKKPVQNKHSNVKRLEILNLTSEPPGSEAEDLKNKNAEGKIGLENLSDDIISKYDDDSASDLKKKEKD